jgi:cytochrome c553
MSRTCINFTTGLIILLLSATTAFAAKKPQLIGGGDPVAGKDKSVLCQSCHGEDGNSPDVNVPKLAGQYVAYLQKQMLDYQSGARKDPVMSGMAATIADKQDLLDIAAYFSSQKPMKADGKKIDKQAGEARFKGRGCERCHVLFASGGKPGNFLAPRIGGQHKAYMAKQLRDFKNEVRTNDPSSVMNRLLMFMSDQDINDVTDYVSEMY